MLITHLFSLSSAKQFSNKKLLRTTTLLQPDLTTKNPSNVLDDSTVALDELPYSETVLIADNRTGNGNFTSGSFTVAFGFNKLFLIVFIVFIYLFL